MKDIGFPGAIIFGFIIGASAPQILFDIQNYSPMLFGIIGSIICVAGYAFIYGSAEYDVYANNNSDDIQHTSINIEEKEISDEKCEVNINTLRNGRKRNNNKNDDLFFAVRNNDIAKIDLLLKSGQYVDSITNDNVTPLMKTVITNNVETAKILLEFGANPNHKTKASGTTPLIKAILNSDINMVKLLLEHGADINLCDDDGRTPLWVAANKNYNELVQLLIHNGADKRIKNIYGETPLDRAIKKNHMKTTEILKIDE